MTLDEIHDLLTEECGLVADPGERGDGRTYFLSKVVWTPQGTTRIVRVLRAPSGEAGQIRLCVSSDNNNSVFAKPPFDRHALRLLVRAEIAAFDKRRKPA